MGVPLNSATDSLISIRGIPKADLLEALWHRSKPAAWFADSKMPAPVFDRHSAVADAKRTGWRLDYIKGRVIKSDLSGDKVNPWGFDRDNGNGAFEECVAALRARK